MGIAEERFKYLPGRDVAFVGTANPVFRSLTGAVASAPSTLRLTDASVI
jgi:hypothetical protein